MIIFWKFHDIFESFFQKLKISLWKINGIFCEKETEEEEKEVGYQQCPHTAIIISNTSISIEASDILWGENVEEYRSWISSQIGTKI